MVHQSNEYSLFSITAADGFDQQSVDGIGKWMDAAVVSLLSNRIGIDLAFMVSSGLICSVLTGLYGYSTWLMNSSFGYSALDHRNVQGSINLLCFFMSCVAGTRD